MNRSSSRSAPCRTPGGLAGAVILAAGLSASCGGAQPAPDPTAPTANAPTAAKPAPPAAAEPAEQPVAAAPSAEPAASETAPTPTAKPIEPAEPPPLPAGTTVLHVGDSMADALGKDLKKELQKRGIKNVLKYQEATYIPEWAGYSMNFPSLVKIHNPDLVIVTLGGNEVAMPDPTIRAEPIRKIVETIGDRPCIWVGAPLWGPHSGILKVIEENCAPCVYVDTNKLIPDLKRLGDGVHPTIPERRRWARVMIDWLARNRDPNGKRPWDFKPQQ